MARIFHDRTDVSLTCRQKHLHLRVEMPEVKYESFISNARITPEIHSKFDVWIHDR